MRPLLRASQGARLGVGVRLGPHVDDRLLRVGKDEHPVLAVDRSSRRRSSSTRSPAARSTTSRITAPFCSQGHGTRSWTQNTGGSGSISDDSGACDRARNSRIFARARHAVGSRQELGEDQRAVRRCRRTGRRRSRPPPSGPRRDAFVHFTLQAAAPSRSARPRARRSPEGRPCLRPPSRPRAAASRRRRASCRCRPRRTAAPPPGRTPRRDRIRKRVTRSATRAWCSASWSSVSSRAGLVDDAVHRKDLAIEPPEEAGQDEPGRTERVVDDELETARRGSAPRRAS